MHSATRHVDPMGRYGRGHGRRSGGCIPERYGAMGANSGGGSLGEIADGYLYFSVDLWGGLFCWTVNG